MTEMSGRPVTILSFSNEVDAEKKIIMHENALREVLLHPDIADRKVAIISILGAFREGKSFLLNYMLRYLYGKVSATLFVIKLLIN
jgi:hypothetical protein